MRDGDAIALRLPERTRKHMMQLYHLDWEESRKFDEKRHFDMVFGLRDDAMAEKFKAAFEAGLYRHVADVEGDDLDYAYHATNNGTATLSWSRQPLKGVHPVEPSFVIAEDGRQLGLRSTSIADIVVRDGIMHVVAMIGFTELGPVPETASAPKP